jgi:hypothetical protein
MVRPAGYLCAVMALGLWAACVGKQSSSADAGIKAPHRDGAAIADGAPGADAAGALDETSADAPPTPTSCQTLRSCVYACRTDMVCVARCIASAPAAARQQYDQANTCSLQACPGGDIDCRCMAECLGGGDCTQVVDECDNAASDPFCDMQCH